MSTFTHENGSITKFYLYGELVFVVVDHSLAEARNLFEGEIYPRSVIGFCYDNGKTTRVKKGDCCEINPDPSDEDLLEAYLDSIGISEDEKFAIL